MANKNRIEEGCQGAHGLIRWTERAGVVIFITCLAGTHRLIQQWKRLQLSSRVAQGRKPCSPSATENHRQSKGIKPHFFAFLLVAYIKTVSGGAPVQLTFLVVPFFSLKVFYEDLLAIPGNRLAGLT